MTYVLPAASHRRPESCLSDLALDRWRLAELTAGEQAADRRPPVWLPPVPPAGTGAGRCGVARARCAGAVASPQPARATPVLALADPGGEPQRGPRPGRAAAGRDPAAPAGADQGRRLVAGRDCPPPRRRGGAGGPARAPAAGGSAAVRGARRRPRRARGGDQPGQRRRGDGVRARERPDAAGGRGPQAPARRRGGAGRRAGTRAHPVGRVPGARCPWRTSWARPGRRWRRPRAIPPASPTWASAASRRRSGSERWRDDERTNPAARYSWSCPLAVGPAALAAGAPRFAVVVGANRGEADDRPLRYAEHDARRVAEALRTVGRFPADQIALVTAGTAAEVREVMQRTNARLRAVARRFPAVRVLLGPRRRRRPAPRRHAA